MCTSLFCLSVCILWYLSNPTAVSVPSRRKQGPPPAAQEGRVQVVSLCQLWDETRWPWEIDATIEADIALSALSVSDASFHQVPM